MGGRGSASSNKSSNGSRITPGLQKHFDKENARVDDFLNSNEFSSTGYKSIEMESGQVFERYTEAALRAHLKLMKSDDIYPLIVCIEYTKLLI